MLWWLPKALPAWRCGSLWVTAGTNPLLTTQVLWGWGWIFLKTLSFNGCGLFNTGDLVWLDVLREYNLSVLPPDWVGIVVCKAHIPPPPPRGEGSWIPQRDGVVKGSIVWEHLAQPGVLPCHRERGHNQSTDCSPAAWVCCVLLSAKLGLWWALHNTWQPLIYCCSSSRGCTLSGRYNLMCKQGAGFFLYYLVLTWLGGTSDNESCSVICSRFILGTSWNLHPSVCSL